MESHDGPSSPPPLDVAVFLQELVQLGVLAAAGARLPGGPAVAVPLSIALPVAVILVWARWLAPRSPRRLAPAPRFTAKLALAVLAGVLLGATGAWVVAAAFLLVSVVLITAAEMPEARRARRQSSN